MENIDALYPVRVCEYEIEDGLTVVHYVDPNPPKIIKWFFKKLAQKPQKIDLDEIGSYVWENCDGNNSVAEISNKLREKFGEKVEPAEERVTQFIHQMNGTQLIKLYEKKQKK